MNSIRNIDRQERKRRKDYGFFGPDSPTWRVWTYPTALTIGFQRSVVVEELDPFLLAAVNSRRGIYTNPKLCYDRTIRYFATVAVGDARGALDAAAATSPRAHREDHGGDTTMNRIWLTAYPPGVPADIDTSRYASLVALMEESFGNYRARGAFACMGKSITYGELDTLSRKLGAWFQSRGLARGARIAIMLPNVLQYPVTLAAILRAGYVVVNVNPLYTPRELEHQLKDSGAEAIVILENFAATLQAVIARTSVRHVVVAAMGDLLGMKGVAVNYVVRRVKKRVPAWRLPSCTRFNAALAHGARHALRRIPIEPGDIAFLQYTGGTTGVSKGATLLHRNIVANVLQSEAWRAPLLAGGPTRSS